MSTARDVYQSQLLIAMHEHRLPGDRIAEALAEVDSHIADTGEDPRDAFGEPEAYARRMSEVLGGHQEPGWFWRLRWTWQDGVISVVVGVATAVAAGGLSGLAAGRDGLLGLPALPSVIAGFVVLTALLVRMVVGVGRLADPVLDPRTGKDVAPLPRWIVPVMVVPIGAVLLVVCVLGFASR